MKVSTTGRGFVIIKFRDKYRQPCSLQESSVGGCIWLGVYQRTDLNTGDPLPDDDNFRMHLTREQVEELLPFLQEFVKSGELETRGNPE